MGISNATINQTVGEIELSGCWKDWQLAMISNDYAAMLEESPSNSDLINIELANGLRDTYISCDLQEAARMPRPISKVEAKEMGFDAVYIFAPLFVVAAAVLFIRAYKNYLNKKHELNERKFRRKSSNFMQKQLKAIR